MIDPRSILDIGANTGQWSKAMLKLLPKASFYLIEANPGCRKHLECLNLPYTIALLGDSVSSAVDFYTLGDTSTGAGVYREVGTDLYEDCEPIQLPQTTLDTLFPMRRFDLIKLDTQGSELDILRGGAAMVRGARWIIMEVSTSEYNEGSPLEPEVNQFMRSIGFPHRITLVGDDDAIQKDVLFSRKKFDSGFE